MVQEGVLELPRVDARRRWPAWLWFLSGSLAVAGVLPLVPWAARVRLYEVVSVAGVVAAFVGIHRARPERLLAWQALAVGTACIFAGDVIFDLYPALRQILAPFPSAADILWLPGYAMLAVGGWMLFQISGPGGRRVGWIDVSIAGVALVAALWVFFVDPQLRVGRFDELDIVIAAYPLVDIFLISLACRFLFVARPWEVGLRLFTVGLGGLLFADLWYSTALARGITQPAWPVSVGWLLWPIALGTVALHPSMKTLGSDLTAERTGSVPRSRVWMLAVLGLVPALAWVQAELLGVPVDGDMVLLQGIVSALMLFRVGGLLREVAAHRARLAAREEERARLLERLHAVAEEERVELSRELHDGPIQHLAGIELGLERVQMRLAAGDVERAAAIAGQLQAQLREEVIGLRRLMADLRPPILTERGLAAALKDHIDALGRRTDLRVAMQATLDQRLEPDAEAVLFRVAQESLSNVVRHARANHVWVWVQRLDGQVELTVRDDGLGFEPETVAERTDRLGLVFMSERLAMVGGTLEVHSRPGSGTVVRARLPVGTEAA